MNQIDYYQLMHELTPSDVAMAVSTEMTNLKDGHTYMGCPAKKVF